MEQRQLPVTTVPALQAAHDSLDRIEQAEVMACVANVASFSPGSTILYSPFGGPKGIHSETVGNFLYNRLVGLIEQDVDRLDGLLKPTLVKTPFRVDVCQQKLTPRLAGELLRRGFEPALNQSFHTRLMTIVPAASEMVSPGVKVKRYTLTDAEWFIAVSSAGSQKHPPGFDAALRCVRESRPTYGMRRYLGWVDNLPVGFAAIHMADGMGFLTMAFTLEKYQDRGVHGAMLHRRLSDAAKAGCKVVGALVTPGSQGERNLLKAGFQVACDRVAWVPRGWDSHPTYQYKV